MTKGDINLIVNVNTMRYILLPESNFHQPSCGGWVLLRALWGGAQHSWLHWRPHWLACWDLAWHGTAGTLRTRNRKHFNFSIKDPLTDRVETDVVKSIEMKYDFWLLNYVLRWCAGSVVLLIRVEAGDERDYSLHYTTNNITRTWQDTLL